MFRTHRPAKSNDDQRLAMDRISFLDVLRWLAAAQDEELLITLVVNPHRPYRHEPRVRKQRPQQYPLRQSSRLELRKSLVNNVDTDERHAIRNMWPLFHCCTEKAHGRKTCTPCIVRPSC